MKPTLLLIPGILNDGSVWDDVARLLQPLADVRCTGVLTHDSVPAMAAAAWSLVADLPADAPLVLAGFSLGGYVALEMLAHPERALKAAALVSTSPRPETPEASAVREKTIAGLGRDFGRAVEGILGFATHSAPPDLTQRLRTMMLRVGAEAAIRQNRATMGRGDHRAALSRLALPVAVACGREDRITPPALSQELAGLIPGASLHLIEGSGHMLPAERPAELAAVLRTLLT